MAEYTAYANYVIFFRDETEFNFAVSVAGGNYILLDPFSAAGLFGIPWPPPTGDLTLHSKGMYGFFPYGLGLPTPPGIEVDNPNPSGVFLRSDTPEVLVPGQPGNPPAAFPVAAPDLRLKWSGAIVRSGGPPPDELETAIPQRRWIVGFETTSEISGNLIFRDASRTVEGCGWAIRGTTIGNISRGLAPIVTATSWERFYIRFHRFGTTNVRFWWGHAGGFANSGIALRISTTGSVQLFEVLSTFGQEILIGAILAPVLNQWYRIDVLLRFDTVNGRVIVFVDGSELISYTSTTVGDGLRASNTHGASDLGRIESGGDQQIEFDLDDWHNAAIPGNYDVNLNLINDKYPIDWLVGTHVKLHFSDSATFPGWTGTQGALNQSRGLVLASSVLASTTSGATIDGLTDVGPLGFQDIVAAVIGPVEGLIETTRTSTGLVPSLGYRLAGGAAILTPITNDVSPSSAFARYNPSGLILPPEISPFHVIYQKGADINPSQVFRLQGEIQYIGLWGPEDNEDFVTINRNFRHNSRYANTAWGFFGPVQNSPVFAVGETYVGNSGYQEIPLPAPCHFIWIRPLSGGGVGLKFFGASIGPCIGITQDINAAMRIFTDIDGQTKFSVNGNSLDINSNGVTYQYIAFCDPGMRFCLCGEVNHSQIGDPSFTNLLIAPDFTPELGFTQGQNFASTGLLGLRFKGPGNSGTTGNGLNNTTIANFGSFGLGTFTSGNAIPTASNYSLWRVLETNCVNVMVQIFSYTGNGAGSQVINLIPSAGRFPLFVLVVPSNGDSSFFRDPSHTGSESSRVDNNGISNIAITAVGIDQITVGTSLNSNGVTYSVFCIPGDTLGMNNGIFFPGNCLPPNEERPEPNPPEGDIIVISEGGLLLGEQTPLTLLKDVSGIYTLVPGKHDDSLIDRQTGQTEVNVAIPDPTFKTGYIGG